MTTPTTPPKTEKKPTEPVFVANFNQDAKFIAVGHQEGYMFYKTNEVLESATLHYEGETGPTPFGNECLILERLFASALMVVVSQREPRIMHIYNITNKKIICDHKFTQSVLSIRINRERIVACLEDCIYIYNLNDMRMMHHIQDTPPNPNGIIDLSTKNGDSLLAYPGSTENGAVHVFDAKSLSSVNTFVAHDGSLAALRFNLDGNMLATASTKGTVIRVYSIPTGTRLFEFRRGMSRCVTISSLAFSSDSSYLSSSSNTETIHVFKLEKGEEIEKPEEVPEPTGWFDVINRTVSAYMPTQVTDLMTTERSFATAHLPGVTRRNVVAIVTHQEQHYVMVATADGFVFTYRLDPNGGELDLVKQHKIGPNAEGQCRGSVSPGGGADASRNQNVMPNVDDPEDFPPMSHTIS